MISFDAVVGGLLGDVPWGRDQFVDDARVHRGLVGRHLHRRRAVRQGAGEECPSSLGIAALRDEDVDDLAVLVDRAVKVEPAAGDLDVGLIDEPAIARGVAWPTVRRR